MANTTEIKAALRTAAARLEREFDGTFGRATIETFLESSYDQFADAATVTTFLPLLAERFARQRLRALARIEDRAHDGLPTVLFLCVHNAGRSQMAAALLHHYAAGRVHVRSAGSTPADQINPAVITVMAEVGVDLSKEFPKPLTTEAVEAADVVVTMGCGDACPVFPGKRYLDWELPDPSGMRVEEVRPIRDRVDELVRELLDTLIGT